MAYFTYENWVRGYAKVHLASCAHCDEGRGVHDAQDSYDGRWLGPFDQFTEAMSAAQATGRETSTCAHCVPG
jgi:hypothetical protein